MKDKMTIILFSGDLDKAIAAFILATTAAASGMEVSIFFTFWGLNFNVKSHHIAADGVSYFSDPVSIFDFSNVSRVLEMLHYLL